MADGGVDALPRDLHEEAQARIDAGDWPPKVYLHKMGGPKGYIQGLVDIMSEGGLVRIGGMRHFNAGPL